MAARWARAGVGKWMARGRSDGSLVARGGFTRVNLGDETVLELGWAVRDARTGRGYATELGRAALDWAAEHRPSEPVVAVTEVHNRASPRDHGTARDAAGSHHLARGPRRELDRCAS